jgi:DNA-binding transcriptional LysR family regulator
MPELRHFRYFVATAEELNFGRAARRLRIAQPSLSRQILDLEREIGVRLFDRNRRGVALTGAGSQFLDGARAALLRVAEAIDLAQRAARGEIGLLRIAYLPGMATSRLPLIVRSFRARHPGVKVVLREAWPEEQRQQLLRGDLEIGFMRGRVAETALATETMLAEEVLVALPTGHPLARRRVLSLRALATEAFVLPDRMRGPAFHDEIVALCRAAGFSPRAAQEGAYLELVGAVASGAGVALVPGSMRRALRAGVVYRRLRERPQTEIAMTWPRATQSPALLDFLGQARSGATIGRTARTSPR